MAQEFTLVAYIRKTRGSNDHSRWSLLVLPNNWQDVTSCLAVTAQISNYLLINQLVNVRKCTWAFPNTDFWY